MICTMDVIAHSTHVISLETLFFIKMITKINEKKTYHRMMKSTNGYVFIVILWQVCVVGFSIFCSRPFVRPSASSFSVQFHGVFMELVFSRDLYAIHKCFSYILNEFTISFESFAVFHARHYVQNKMLAFYFIVFILFIGCTISTELASISNRCEKSFQQPTEFI